MKRVKSKVGSKVFHSGILVAALLLALFCASSHAQFYTGSSQTFGRKRVQYNRFFWTYYRFDGFDVYFTARGKNLALYTANYVQNHLDEMENLTRRRRPIPTRAVSPVFWITRYFFILMGIMWILNGKSAKGLPNFWFPRR